MALTSNGLLICSQEGLLPSDGYPFLLAFSLDNLLVIDRSREVVIEWIHVGQDNNGFVLMARDEDSFLDAILISKQAISEGIHPLKVFIQA